MTFNGWSAFVKYNETLKNKIYPVAQLNKMGLKPKDKNIYELHSVRYYDQVTEYKFYSLDNTIPKRAKSVPVDMEPTAENLCQALFLISQSAIKSRDTAAKCHRQQQYDMAHRASMKKLKLYALKDKVVEKMADAGILKPEGWVIQTLLHDEEIKHFPCDVCEDYIPPADNSNKNKCDDYEYCNKRRAGTFTEFKQTEEKVNLFLYTCGDYKFYWPYASMLPEDANIVGHYEGLMKLEESPHKSDMRMIDAVTLLCDYVEDGSAA